MALPGASRVSRVYGVPGEGTTRGCRRVAHCSPEEIATLRREVEGLDEWWASLRREVELHRLGQVPAWLEIRCHLAEQLRWAVAQSLARGVRHRKECRAGEAAA
jgi:hypothetical protein